MHDNEQLHGSCRKLVLWQILAERMRHSCKGNAMHIEVAARVVVLLCACKAPICSTNLEFSIDLESKDL